MTPRPSVAIRRVARLGSGHTPSRQHPEYWEDCAIPWFTLADVGQLRDGTKSVVNTTSEMISEVGLAHSAAELHPAGTVILSRTASVGFTAILGRDMATSQDFATWTCGPLISPRYLLYSLRGQPQQIEARKMGSTHKTIYMPDIETLRTPLPSLHEQERIADYLDSETSRIDTLIEKKHGMIALLAEQFAASTEQVIWRGVTKLGPLMYRTDPSRPIMYGIVLPGPDVSEGVPIVKGGDVAAQRLTPLQLNRTTYEIELPYARARLRSGDLVIAIRGGIGDVEVVPPSLTDANITQDVARIASGRGVDSSWLRFVLLTQTARAQVEERTTGATIKGLNIWELKRIQVPMSDSARQAEDLGVLHVAERRANSLIAALKRQLELAAEHRQALITAAVAGELDIEGLAA